MGIARHLLAMLVMLTLAQAVSACPGPGAPQTLRGGRLPAPPSTPVTKPSDLAPWRTISVGHQTTELAVRQAMDGVPCLITIGDSAGEILGRPQFAFSAATADLELVVLSVRQLGFSDSASRADIYARATALGLALCPPEAGPALRLAYLDQPVGEFLDLAMQPLARYAGDLTAFSVGNDGTMLLLVGGDGDPSALLPTTTRLVFVWPHALAGR